MSLLESRHCQVDLIAVVYNLATLSGMLLLFNTPGSYNPEAISLAVTPHIHFSGNLAGAPIFGALLNSTGGKWQAAICYSGAIQLVGVGCIMYGKQGLKYLGYRLTFSRGHSALQDTTEVVRCRLRGALVRPVLRGALLTAGSSVMLRVRMKIL